MAEKPRIVFMGTAPFAASVLRILAASNFTPLAVYTRPDKPAGRGMALRESAVKAAANELALPVFQPASFRDAWARDELAALKPDFLIVAAYGLILPQSVLDIPTIAPINVHGSILPEYRGAAPIQRAIMENWQPNATTGVSIMKMEAGLDTGPVYATASTSLAGKTTASLAEELACLGSQLLIKTLPQIAAGELEAVPQDNSKATHAAKLCKEDGNIDWHCPCIQVDARIRAVTPWPGAQTVITFGERQFPITILAAAPGESAQAEPGTVRLSKNGLAIACLDNWCKITELQPQGRKKMSAQAFVNGLRLPQGEQGKA